MPCELNTVSLRSSSRVLCFVICYTMSPSFPSPSSSSSSPTQGSPVNALNFSSFPSVPSNCEFIDLMLFFEREGVSRQVRRRPTMHFLERRFETSAAPSRVADRAESMLPATLADAVAAL